MKILIEDFLKYADITNSAAIVTAAGHPIENIQDSRLSRNAWIIPSSLQGLLYGMSMYGANPYYEQYATAEVIIDFDLKAVQTFDTFGLAGNNFTLVNITLSWAVSDIETPDGSVSISGGEAADAIVIPTGLQNAQYFRVSIGNVAPDGNYEVIGRMALGLAEALPGIRPIIDVDITSTANRTFSDSQQLYGGPKVIYKRLNVTFPEIDDPTDLIALFTKIDLYNPIFLIWNEPFADNEANLYCTLSDEFLPRTLARPFRQAAAMSLIRYSVTSGGWSVRFPLKHLCER